VDGATVHLFKDPGCASNEVGTGQALSSGATTFNNVDPATTGNAGTPVNYCAKIANVTGSASAALFSVTVYSAPAAGFGANTPVVAKGGTTTFFTSFLLNGGSVSIVDDTGVDIGVTIQNNNNSSPVTVNRTTRYTLLVTNGAGKLASQSVSVTALNTVVQTRDFSLGARFDATATLL
jgi:hypothetical protein